MVAIEVGSSTHRPGSRWGDKPVRIRLPDRLHHLYVVGRTGAGKSTLLGNLIEQDFASGTGLALFDPHGDLVERVLPTARAHRPDDLIYLDVADPSCRFHFNPLGGIPPEKRPLAAAGLVEVFRKMWHEDWGPRLEHLLRNVVLTLLEIPGSTLADIPELLADRKYRREVAARLSNEEVKSFWRDEFERYSPAFRAVVTAPLQNKVGTFLADPRLKEILSGERSSFNLRQVMDEGKVLLVNLSRGRLGESPATLLGSLLVSSLTLAAFERAEVAAEERKPFFLYLDEFQTFSTLSLATALSELRKYGLGLVLAHQYLGQLQPEIRDAVLGNAGTMIAFRLGAQDARFLAPEFAPVFEPEDLLSLPNHNIYLRLMIDGEPSKPFSARTMPPSPPEGPLPVVAPSREAGVWWRR